METNLIKVKKRLYSQVANAKDRFRKLYGETPYLPIDYDLLAKSLGLPAGDINDFEIEHIIPLSYLMNGSHERLQEAFSIHNLRWLKKEDNRAKRNEINPFLEIEIFNKQNHIN